MSENDFYSDIYMALGFVKTDTMSNLEAKRGCQWANRIIVTTIEAVEHFKTIKDLYLEGKQVDFKDIFSAFLEKKNGCLAAWQAACGDCITEKTPPNKDEKEALDFAGSVLWQNFLSIFGPMPGEFSAYDCTGVAIRMQDVAEKDNKTTRTALKESIQFHTLNIAETCYRLTLREWKLWYDHKDWTIDWGEWEVDGPFDGREVVEKFYPVLKAFDEKHHGVFADLYLALHGLLHESGRAPRAFIFKDSPKAPLRPFDRSVVALLTMNPMVSFEYPPDLAAVMGTDVQTYVPSRFLLKSRGLFLQRLYNSIRANAKKAPSDESRRMWLEVAAEILQNLPLRQPVYTQEAAERIVALADRAQRESWIERMMKLTGKKKEVEPASFEPQPAPPAPTKQESIDEVAVIERTKAYAKAYIDGLCDGNSATDDGKKGGRGKGKGKGKGKKSKTRGRQTEKMVLQFGLFQKYLNLHHVVQHCSLETLKSWVHRFWLENENEFKKAAKKKDQEKGYGSEAMILRAARNKGYGPPKKQ